MNVYRAQRRVEIQVIVSRAWEIMCDHFAVLLFQTNAAGVLHEKMQTTKNARQ